MYEMMIFNNSEFGKVRTVAIDGEPWFVGKDVARALGYSNTKDALGKHVDSEDKRGSQIATPSGKQQMTVINESGVYSLIFSSKLPKAKEFKRWVTSEVLPTIRKQGGYLTPAAAEQLQELAKAAVQGLSDRVTALENAMTDPFGTIPTPPAPMPAGRSPETQRPGRDHLKRWMRTASEKLDLLSNKFNMSGNAVLHYLYGYLEEDFGVVLTDERIRIMEKFGLKECSTLKAVFYDEELRGGLEDLMDYNLAPENRGW